MLTEKEIEVFLNKINFNVPTDFIEFLKGINSTDFYINERYLLLWPLSEMIKLNEEYNVEKYAPNFFIFGSNGGGTAYAIEKETGHIFEIPFIGMSNEDATFITKNFIDFMRILITHLD